MFLLDRAVLTCAGDGMATPALGSTAKLFETD